MPDISIRMRIDAPLDQVFDAIGDHETFLHDGRTRTTILRPGVSDRNGLGCFREVRAGRRTRFVEEITAWERPNAFEYRIRECSMPLRHDGGRLAFHAEDGHTVVEWTSRFAIPVPLVGGLLAAVAKRVLVGAFTRLLLQAKTKLER
ncbi:MAG: hypothetical protein NVS3B10_24890 [Polyangiales bacterium]